MDLLIASRQFHLTHLHSEHLKSQSLKPFQRFGDVTDVNELYALHLLRLAFAHYDRDIIKCVTQGVRSLGEIENQRSAALKKWTKLVKQPGAFNADHPSMRELLISVCGYNPAELAKNLPPADNVQLSHHELASRMYIQVNPNRQSAAPRAPFIARGTFQVMLRLTVNKLSEEFGNIRGKDFDSWVTAKIQHVLEAYRYKVIPWAPRDTRQLAAVWNNWALVNVLSPIDGPTPAPAQATHSSAVEAAIAQAISSHQQSDPTRPWSISEVHATDLLQIIQRGTAPQWESPTKKQKVEQSPDSLYVSETYAWAQRVFDIRRPTHYLALVIGFIMGKMCPNISYDKSELANLFKDKPHAIEARTRVGNMSWTASRSIAHKDAGRVASAFIVSVMAITDTDSPLRRYMPSDGGSVGVQWSRTVGE